jgi:hypothetical protein
MQASIEAAPTRPTCNAAHVSKLAQPPVVHVLIRAAIGPVQFDCASFACVRSLVFMRGLGCSAQCLLLAGAVTLSQVQWLHF